MKNIVDGYKQKFLVTASKATDIQASVRANIPDLILTN
jgi:hypothetical protein